MPARRTAPLLALLAIAGVVARPYSPRRAASQVGFGMSQQERDTIKTILATDAARYLPSDGLNTLLLLGRKGLNTAWANEWRAVHRESSGARTFTEGLWEIEVKALSKASVGRPAWHPEVAVR